MRIFCRGFNLYNQLNGQENCVAEFTPTIDADFDFLKIEHTFSLLLFSSNTLKIYCKFAPKDVVEYKHTKITQISANDNIILILNDLGQLYKTTIDNLSQIEPLVKFTEDNDVIKLITCGSKLSMAYTQNGMLYSIPEKLNFTNSNIVDIKTGREHCVLLDKLGNVYSCGRGSRGQLGHGELDDELNPRLVEALAGIKISSIAAGGWHSAAISQDGDLYIWGWNSNGQLGLSSLPTEEQDKSVSVMATPYVVDIQSCSENLVLKVACGNKHSIILLDNNMVYGTGWNKYKQLKNEEQENYYSFVFLCDFSNEHVEDILCGSWNSAVICKNKEN